MSRKRKVIYAIPLLFLLQLVVSGLAALVMPVGGTKIVVRSLTLDLIPDRSLPMVVDAEALAPDAAVEVIIGRRTTRFEKASQVIIRAPQKDACPYLHIGPGSEGALEILPDLPPKDPSAATSLADRESDRLACTWFLSMGEDRGVVLRPGDVLRLPWRTDGGPSPIELGRVSAIRGAATRLEGAFAFEPRDHGPPRSLAIASEWLSLVAIYRDAHDARGIGVDIESGRPSMFAVDRVNKKPSWFAYRWWHFFWRVKASVDLIRSVFGGG
jgi:hypothetical protein